MFYSTGDVKVAKRDQRDLAETKTTTCRTLPLLRLYGTGWYRSVLLQVGSTIIFRLLLIISLKLLSTLWKMASGGDKPKIIVFDLDYTLWPFWVDTHVTPPFRKDKNGSVIDRSGQKIKVYPEVPNVLEKLFQDGYVLAVASRTGEIDGANKLIDLFGWEKYFQYKEIYPGCKIQHFNQFKKQSGIPFEEMLFFDDEHRNIRDLTALGVTSVLVTNGVTMKIVQDALSNFSAKKN